MKRAGQVLLTPAGPNQNPTPVECRIVAKANPIPPFPADLDRDQFGYWLSGFADGEGHFALYTGESVHAGYTSRHFASCFYIGLRDDDRPILELIQSFWNCGQAIQRKGRAEHGSQPQAAYRVRMISDVRNIIVPHFRRFPLRAKKARDFEIWAQAVELLWTVTRRPKSCRGRGNGKGSGPRWMPDESARFHAFVSDLKELRKYRAPT